MTIIRIIISCLFLTNYEIIQHFSEMLNEHDMLERPPKRMQILNVLLKVKYTICKPYKTAIQRWPEIDDRDFQSYI